MCKILLYLVAYATLTLTASGQEKSKQNPQTDNIAIYMGTNKLTNPIVKAAFEAWQNGECKTFLSYFTVDAKLYDDGKPRNLLAFVTDACGHEKFITIDKIENSGLDIYGNFHTEKWGDFKTYFKFHIHTTGKIDWLSIGQTN